MKVGSFRLPISAGSETPDPATICPAAGYIENPLTEAKGWYKIAEFQTNSPSTTTFDPQVTANSGIYSWDLGDGTICMDTMTLSHTYDDSSTKTVKLYRKGTSSLYFFDFQSDNIVGSLDLRDDCFKTLSTIQTNNNLLLTELLLSPTFSGIVQSLRVYSTGVAGTLNLSMITAFTATATIHLYAMPSLLQVTFATVISGTISNLFIHTTGVAGTLNLSMFTTFAASALVYLYNNPEVIDIQFYSSIITGTLRYLFIHTCPKLGYVNLLSLTSGFNVNSADWRLNDNKWTAAIVNHMLHDLNTIASSGFTGRIIYIGGNNAAPDRSSDGYDGIAEKAALVAKGITVNATLTTATIAATAAATNIAQITATSGGNVTNEGGGYVTAKGVCWRTTSNPTIADSKTNDGSGLGIFTSNMTGLAANTTYYVRAYATNSAGTSYGAQISFKTLP